MTFLLDTNVVSELRRRSPNPQVVAWFANHRQDDLYLSALTIGELRQGVEGLRRRDAGAAQELDRWLTGLLSAYLDHVVPVTSAVADRWGRLNVPDRLPVIDGLLAATALVHGWTFVTRNGADVARTGVRTLDPFEVSA
jgi:predicted nucleic acid-binding protein